MCAGSLEGVLASLTRTNTDSLIEVVNKDLAVADLAGKRGLGAGVDGGVYLAVIDGHFNLHLGQEIDHILCTPIKLRMALLAAEPFDFRHRDAGHADVRKCLSHLVQLERLDARCTQL